MTLHPRQPRPSAGGRDVSPHDLLATIVADCARTRRVQGHPPLTTVLDVPEDHAIEADPAQVRRVLEPLVKRAFAAAAQPDAGREVTAVREVVVTSVATGDAVEIEVADSGPGLADHVRRWLSQTGPSTDGTVPEGAGLALAAVRAAAARIGGTLRAVNCPEGGVAITLRLPCRQARRLAA